MSRTQQGTNDIIEECLNVLEMAKSMISFIEAVN